MLSYRHSYHAGNFADVLKHIVLIEILEHMLKKDKPVYYFDTHAGAGFYDLRAPRALKLQESRQGVGLLEPAQWPELAQYFQILDALNPGDALHYYPGSPLIAAKLLRPSDRLWFYELHGEDARLLEDNFCRDRRVKCSRSDGYAGLLAQLPPLSRRGLALIDPSYEIKSDYQQVVKVLEQSMRRFATGSYALWYPVVERSRIRQMERDLLGSGIANIQRFELCVQPDSDAPGMTGAGMVVVNPPWTLMDKMTTVLPRLAAVLGQHPHASFKADVLVGQ